MKVQLLRDTSGNEAGSVVELDEPSARWLIDHGSAREVPQAKPAAGGKRRRDEGDGGDDE